MCNACISVFNVCRHGLIRLVGSLCLLLRCAGLRLTVVLLRKSVRDKFGFDICESDNASSDDMAVSEIQRSIMCDGNGTPPEIRKGGIVVSRAVAEPARGKLLPLDRISAINGQARVPFPLPRWTPPPCGITSFLRARQHVLAARVKMCPQRHPVYYFNF